MSDRPPSDTPLNEMGEARDADAANHADESPGDAMTRTLRPLAVPAPADTFVRFRRRAAVVQGTRMLFESQVIGFWVVLDALLRLLLGSGPGHTKSRAQGAVPGAVQGERA